MRHFPLSIAMNFCSACGARVELKTPAGDNRPRYVCPQCSTVHYINPKLVLGTIPVWQDKVLLCRRAIEPRYGFWTLPAGFMEVGETTEQGALRETLEEAGATVQLQQLYSVIDVAHVEQVHLFYLAKLASPDFAAGEESLEVKLFTEAEIPWQEIAFRTVGKTLQWFFSDRKTGQFALHQDAIGYPPPAS
jgi:ADP-ribose pyrophosphatase YjhB (NUDIX family)